MLRKRERRSLIVNSIFDRSAGKLIVNADKLIFRSMRESYQDKSSKDTQNLQKCRSARGYDHGQVSLVRTKPEGVAEGEFTEKSVAWPGNFPRHTRHPEVRQHGFELEG